MAARRFPFTFPVGLFAGLLLFAGCRSGGEPAVTSGNPPEEYGSFSVSLSVGGKYTFSQFSYDVSGNAFHKADTLDVSASTTVSAVVGGIPFGSGYQLKLTAQDDGHKLTPCMGTASFDITSPTTVPVPVTLNCREIPALTAAVPVPPWTKLLLGALLLALGARLVRARRARESA
jgi:hypothetical protein